MITFDELSIPGVYLITPRVFGDNRGYFKETWNHAVYSKNGVNEMFVQDNISRSSKGVLRGLHYQNPNPQGKLLYVIEGKIFDVVVDIRSGSPSFKQWLSVELSANNHRQIYVPPGFAHGFCVLSETAIVTYKCTTTFDPHADACIAWNDPGINIDWPIASPSLSSKDSQAPFLDDISVDGLPAYPR